MPMHEYICTECSHVTEKLLRARKNTITTRCEKCGGRAKRIVSAANFSGEKDWRS